MQHHFLYFNCITSLVSNNSPTTIVFFSCLHLILIFLVLLSWFLSSAYSSHFSWVGFKIYAFHLSLLCILTQFFCLLYMYKYCILYVLYVYRARNMFCILDSFVLLQFAVCGSRTKCTSNLASFWYTYLCRIRLQNVLTSPSYTLS